MEKLNSILRKIKKQDINLVLEAEKIVGNVITKNGLSFAITTRKKFNKMKAIFCLMAGLNFILLISIGILIFAIN